MSTRLELEASKSVTLHPTYIVPSKIDELPQELISQIFSYLSNYDLQNLACVNQSILSRVKEAARFNELKPIQDFIESLLQRLVVEIFAEQRLQLKEISEKIIYEDFPNLRQLKTYILDVKTELIDVIKTLDPETVNDLSDHMQPPHFLKDIFQLAAFERRIDEANLLPIEFARDCVLLDISEELLQAGHIDRTIEIATSFSQEVSIWSALQKIIEALIQASNFDKAIKVAKLIPEEKAMECMLRHISVALRKAGHIDRAIEVATLLSSEFSWKDCTFSEISKDLAQAGNINRAIEVARLIPTEPIRENALENIIKDLIQAGNFDKAMEVASFIHREQRREDAIRNISNAMPGSLVLEIFKTAIQSCNIL